MLPLVRHRVLGQTLESLDRLRTLDRALDRFRTLGRALDRALDRFRTLGRDRALDRFRTRSRDRALGRFWTRDWSRDWTRYLLNGNITRAQVPDQIVESWEAILGQPEIHTPVLDTLCEILDLKPQPQWWEALRLRWLPRVPERITLTDAAIWKRTWQAFDAKTADESDCRHAASQLLLDAWLYLVGYVDSPDQSPFAKLVKLTRNQPSALLQVAHCIRDLAYGDASREEDLICMVRSDDPSFRKLFEAAFWRDRTGN